MHEPASVVDMFESIEGVQSIRLEPIIDALIIEYDIMIIDWRSILDASGLYFSHIQKKAENAQEVGNELKKDVLRSIVSGGLLLISFVRRVKKPMPDMFDYLTVIATSYTVLSHGENRLTHPDVLTGVISIALNGTENIMRIASITWIVNLIEVMIDIRKGLQQQPFAI